MVAENQLKRGHGALQAQEQHRQNLEVRETGMLEEPNKVQHSWDREKRSVADEEEAAGL